MPLVSLEARELERVLTENLNALRRLDRRNRDESNELIRRIRNFIKSFRPDLFEERREPDK